MIWLSLIARANSINCWAWHNISSMDEKFQKFEIQKIFVRDISFQSPNAPQVFREEWKPDTDIHLAAENRQLADDIYEVTLNITINFSQNEKTAFLVELKQSGIFLIQGFANEQRDHLLGSYCPHALFPFAREAVADLISKGGFPPLLLSPVNFDALYAQQSAKIKPEAPFSETRH